MFRALVKLVGGLLVALGAIAAVFLLGMRRKSPVVLDAVRKSGRAMKPLVLKTAGTPGVYAAVIRHVGRTTGRAYETPVGAVATEDGFVIALPYGRNTDWLKNVLASGSATIVADGNTYEVDQPDVVPIADAQHHFSEADQRAHRWFRVDECLRVKRVQPNEPSTSAGDRA